MKNKTKLQSKAEEFELPVKPELWKNIEKQLPEEKKRKPFLFWWFSGILLLGIAGSLVYLNINTDDKKTSVVAGNEKSDKSTEPGNKLSGDKFESDQVISAENSGSSEPGKTRLNNSEGSKVLFPGIMAVSKESPSPDNNNKGTQIDKNELPQKTNKEPDSLAGVAGNSLKKHSETKVDSQSTVVAREKTEEDTQSQKSQIKTKPKLKPDNPGKGGFFILAGLGAFDAQLRLKPSLMKIPAGFGKQLILGVGKHFKNYSLGLGLEYNGITQSTTMPGTYNPDYVKVLDPNTASAVPELYRNKLSDTNSLLVPGSSHDKINQSFSLLGFGVDFRYKLFGLNKFSATLVANPKYTRMLGARTFFWDNLNSIGVPFYEKDQKIVKVNQLSAAIRLNFNYKFTQSSSIWVAPYYEQYFSPFLKHYYQVSFRNWGASTGVQLEF